MMFERAKVTRMTSRHVLADDALEQQALQAETEYKGNREHDDGRCHRIEAERRRQHQQRISRPAR